MLAYLADDVASWWHEEGVTVLAVALVGAFLIVLAVIVSAYCLLRAFR